VALDGVTNPSATGSVTTSVSTSSDLNVVTASTSIGSLHALSNVTVSLSSAAAGAPASYSVGLTTSTTGALTAGGGSTVTVVLPSGSSFGSYTGGSVTDVTTGQRVASCQVGTGTTITCPVTISTHAGDVLAVLLSGITNPTTPAPATVTVSTSTDTTPVATSVTIVADQGVANLSVAPASTTAHVTTTWNVGFKVSSSGGLSGDAGSTVTVVLPSSVGLGSFVTGTVTDTTTAQQIGSGCNITGGTTVVCPISASAPAGDALLVALDGVTNPSATGPVSATVSTSSDRVTSSKSTTITAAQSVSGLAVTPSSTATGATVSDTVGFTTSSTGALGDTPNSSVTVTLPVGTGLGGFQSGTLVDVTRGTSVGSCAPTTGVTVVCLVQSSDVASGDALSASWSGVTNPSAAGSYTVSVATSSDTTTAVSPALAIVAVTADAGDPVVTTVGSAVAFNGSGSQPSVGIQSYTWEFGDGSGSATGEQVSHTFTISGTYSVSLTVAVGSATDTDTIQITVNPAPVQQGGLVTVTDASSNPLAGATVAVIAADGDKYAGTTTAAGVATLNDLPDGPYTVYAWTSGYLPNTGAITIAGGDGNATVVLQSGNVAQTSLTSTPLTAQQVAAAGIDPNDPANQNVFQFEIHLAFFGSVVDFSGYTSSGNGGVLLPSFDGDGGGGGGEISGCACWAVPGTGEDIYPVVQYDSGEPTILWMIIPGKAQWLKEFFSVQMVVTNLAPSAFSLSNGQATLGDLPDGLSLAPTGTPQSLAEALPTIPGGGSAQAQWIIRGDTAGFYGLNAQYRGTLQPLGATVTLPAATSADAIHVWGGSALTMTVDADDQAVTGNPYLVRIGLTNNADVPIYNPDVQLLTTDARLNYIYQPDEQLTQGTDVIQPGATYWTNYYRLVSEITGNLQTDLSFVKMTAGNSDLTYSIISHPAVTDVPPLTGVVQGNGVQLTWSAPSVSGITGYEVFYTPTRDTLFGPTPVATLPASATSAFISNGPAGFYALSTVTAGGLSMYNNLAAVTGTGSGPTISLTPSTLAGAGTSTVTGSGFLPGKAKVSIYLDTTSGKALTSLKVTATGQISKALKLSKLTGGNHQLIAVQAGEPTASATLAVTSLMTIKPTSAKPGATATATLTAFKAGEAVVFHWGSATGTTVGTSTVGATGAGTAVIAVPATAAAGTYLVYAVGGAGTTVSTSLKVK
jgi:PKD repeat protein